MTTPIGLMQMSESNSDIVKLVKNMEEKKNDNEIAHGAQYP